MQRFLMLPDGSEAIPISKKNVFWQRASIEGSEWGERGRRQKGKTQCVQAKYRRKKTHRSQQSSGTHLSIRKLPAGTLHLTCDAAPR
jgi:hypothetical protein